MESILNPFAPGAGTRPYAMAGRDAILEEVRVSIGRVVLGRPAKNHALIGLRGVGKTVLLEEIRSRAENTGHIVVQIEAPEKKSLPAALIPELRLALVRFSRRESAKDLAQRGLRALAGFASAMKLKFSDVEVQFDIEPEVGLADIGDLEHDLSVLLETIATAAQRTSTALILLIDELQHVPTSQLGPLISALHRCAQRQLPIILIGAGLPQLRGRIGNAKTYAERMIEFSELSVLNRTESIDAICIPLQSEGVQIEADALELILDDTQGYPYFLQEWGKHAWNCAQQSPITRRDVEDARVIAHASLDVSFFGVRFDRVTQKERLYLATMAALGKGPYETSDVSDAIGESLQELAALRSRLIEKGMIYSPRHGLIDFTVPLFGQFILRRMPPR
ncbi:MAG: ATP-binding protein [Candidatus Kapabacteria bacterium]|nr:ATP-binding protein [Candidatus Kapabacteria bacterium]